MKKRITFLAIFFVLVLSSSCNIEPKEIAYGNDHCHYCDMTVVDKGHAAEYVTKKGKAYIFDSIECLQMKINEDKNEELMAFILVSDFSNIGALIDAKTATYLICDKIKSPMGANITAFSEKEDAVKTKNENGGELFTWKELKQKQLH